MTEATPQDIYDFTGNPDNTELVAAFLQGTHPGIIITGIGYGKPADGSNAITVFSREAITNPPAEFIHAGITYPLAFVVTGEVIPL